MNKDELREYLDHHFRKLFLDKDQKGFRVGDDILIVMDRNKTLKTSKIEIYKKRKKVDTERLGRYKTYKDFLGVMVVHIGLLMIPGSRE